MLTDDRTSSEVVAFVELAERFSFYGSSVVFVSAYMRLSQ